MNLFFCLASKSLYHFEQAGANQELYKAVETLRDQLNSQKESVQKYEHKIRKRETELKEKIQESRKLKADAANANLQLEKMTKERDVLRKSVENFEAVDEEKSRDLERLKADSDALEEAKKDLVNARDEVDTKESEIEAKSSEIDALKETIQTLETIIKSSSSGKEAVTLKMCPTPAQGSVPLLLQKMWAKELQGKTLRTVRLAFAV